MKSQYGTNNCHLLQINARSPHATDTAHTDQMPDPWGQFVKRKTEVRKKDYVCMWYKFPYYVFNDLAAIQRKLFKAHKHSVNIA